MNHPTITPIDVGRLRFDLSAYFSLPDDHAYAGQTADVPVQSFHIALPGRSVLVDAVSHEPEEFADMMVPGYTPPPTLLEQLEERGIAARAISDVIITHLHFDHYGALGKKVSGGYEPAFPNARHYLNRADWTPEHFDELEEYTLLLAKKHGLLQLVEGQVELGDGLTLLPAAGETAGHQMVHLAYSDQNFYFGGDLYHHPLEFSDSQRHVSWAKEAQMAASKAAFIRRLAGDGGQAYFTHIEGAHHVVNQEDGSHAWRPGS